MAPKRRRLDDGQGVDICCTDPAGRVSNFSLFGDTPIEEVDLQATVSCAIPPGYAR
jgi:hypothetical protein